ncbi:Nickel uptake substrate-specific transmembrane region [Gemmata obscuriglobus]|uniref:DUF4198 domain-containing protein n=1 Tax=Gemmata obscuriglobus TaxID=114 RepID=A0A2Z3H5X8_9BACT|nr:DUF4198 domain-containing protein [Gemmata obscuriglobus]AWM41158.1 DUF4198 domain-containing protein [Gemmata obscuriglobus]QEG25506.1 Nickel uptake substrate-specific transmembrane region [Gemmata obscuriglobus]VTR98784.1 Uncharacterized protein OS=Phycisphaera mikurensis (strain NBRC 102666 / KCTC 22515 / FYK2301M01) GN=PSMK_26110 PE=4 SV=1 [Gemmata obscuriglobus UQM 2246]
MYRMLGAVAVALSAAGLSQAHFPFVVPDAKGDSAKVVFSDALEPDPAVNIEKIANTKLTLRDAGGKESALEWKKDDGFYAVNVPGSGDRVVYGVTDYGVLQKGDAKPFKLVYLPKAAIGTATAKPVGAKLALEVAADGKAGALRFQVLAAGKPLAGSEVTVMLPSGGKKAVTTDKDGYTPAFDATGRYGVYAKHVEAKAGEHAGKKYDEVRTYATLVCDVAK